MIWQSQLSKSFFFIIITTHAVSTISFGFCRSRLGIKSIFSGPQRFSSILEPVSSLLLSNQGRIKTRTSSLHRSTRMSSAASESVGLQDIGGETADDNNMTIPDRSWKSRMDESIGKSRKIRGGNFVQLATVDTVTQEPRCRTVVFRGFLPTNSLSESVHVVTDDGSSCVMKMITDGRSNKVKESSSAELVWWFSKTNEQYRVRGTLVYVGDESDNELLLRARKEQWGNLSEKAREQFFWKEPGLPYHGESDVPTGGRDKEGVLLPPPASFRLVLLVPSRCEYLRLTDNYRQIDELQNGTWQALRVNP